ncbi:MAG: hypothetical protein JW830_11970, partial [Bacteroidales bacterium]|nr:hypothetical protein [Bacteroidales bacterium]
IVVSTPQLYHLYYSMLKNFSNFLNFTAQAETQSRQVKNIFFTFASLRLCEKLFQKKTNELVA